MTKVKLVKDFFGPDGTLYEKGVHQFPDEWVLPKSAEKLAEVKVEAKAETAKK